MGNDPSIKCMSSMCLALLMPMGGLTLAEQIQKRGGLEGGREEVKGGSGRREGRKSCGWAVK